MYQKVKYGTYAIFSWFHCSMGTLRIIRVGTRNYNKRIAAAVSQEYVLVCTTRKVTRPENDMVLVLASKLTLVIVWVVEIDVISVWGIGVDLISVYGSSLTRFCVRVENDLV